MEKQANPVVKHHPGAQFDSDWRLKSSLDRFKKLRVSLELNPNNQTAADYTNQTPHVKALLLAVIAFTFPSFASDANSLTSSEMVFKKAIDRVMSELSHGEPGDEVAKLFDKYWADNKIAASKAAELNGRFKSDLIRNAPTSGKPIKEGYEMLGVRRMGGSVVRLVYLLKFEASTAAWTFLFYKAKDEYKLTNITYGKEAIEDANAFVVSVPFGH